MLVDFRPSFERDQMPAGVVAHEEVIRDYASKNLNPQKTTFQALLNKRFTIPEYQRDYSWEEQHWEDLWNELRPLFTTTITPTNRLNDVFLGVMFLAEKGSSDDLEIIDGQQRLTTVSILLRAIHGHLLRLKGKTLAPPELENVLALNEEDVRRRIFSAQTGYGPPVPRIQAGQLNQATYQLVMAPPAQQLAIALTLGTVHGNRKVGAIRGRTLAKQLGLAVPSAQTAWLDSNLKMEESNKQIVKCYEYFTTKLSECLATLTAEESVRLLCNTKGYVLHCLSITTFTVSRDSPALLMEVFEVLNDRGMELALTDVIRARVVAKFRQEAPGEADQYIQKWTQVTRTFGNHYDSLRDFLIDYLTSKRPDLGPRSFFAEGLLEAFEANPVVIPNRVSVPSYLDDLANAKALVDDLVDAAPKYAAISGADPSGLDLGDLWHSARATDSIKRLNSLGTRQWRAFVFAAYRGYRSTPGASTPEQFVKLLDAVERTSFRQAITGVNANRLEGLYKDACKEFSEHGFTMDTPQFLAAKFRGYYDQNVLGADFVKRLITKSGWNVRLAKALLWRLIVQDWGADRAEIRRLNDDAVHLEHVLPQQPLLGGTPNPMVWYESFLASDADALAGARAAVANPTLHEEWIDAFGDLFINDLANNVLLLDSINQGVKNSPLSNKAPAYASSPLFASLSANDPFSQRIPTQFATWFKVWQARDAVLRKDLPRAHQLGIAATTQTAAKTEAQALVAAHAADEQALDTYWTANQWAARRKDLVKRLLEVLEFPSEGLPALFDPSKIDEELADRLLQLHIEA